MLKGLGFFAEFQLKMLTQSRKKVPNSGKNCDPAEVIKKHLSEKISKELKRNTMVVYKSYHMSQAACIGQNFTIEDFAHMDFHTLVQILSTFMPIVGLPDKQDAYLLGTEVKKMTVKKNDCMVSVGGGFMSVQEYYD